MDIQKYENLIGHMEHHNIKEWLLRGADAEDARTIWAAINDIPERRLIRRLARALSR
jgi:hypothetical protein